MIPPEFRQTRLFDLNPESRLSRLRKFGSSVSQVNFSSASDCLHNNDNKNKSASKLKVNDPSITRLFGACLFGKRKLWRQQQSQPTRFIDNNNNTNNNHFLLPVELRKSPIGSQLLHLEANPSVPPTKNRTDWRDSKRERERLV